jgi:very-short-patch-repair endonuclease
MKRMTAISHNLRNNATPWENKLWYEFLRNYDVPFHRQIVKGKYILDYYCSKAKLAIELDGGGHYTDSQKEADDKRTAELNKHGIEVLRFSNLDVDKNFYEVCTVIDEKIKSIIGK